MPDNFKLKGRELYRASIREIARTVIDADFSGKSASKGNAPGVWLSKDAADVIEKNDYYPWLKEGVEKGILYPAAMMQAGTEKMGDRYRGLILRDTLTLFDEEMSKLLANRSRQPSVSGR